MIFIPFSGVALAYIATALVTLSVNAFRLVLLTAVFLGIHIPEGCILTPLVQKWAVYLPPAIVAEEDHQRDAVPGFLQVSGGVVERHRPEFCGFSLNRLMR